jgi:hypothetical protein
MIGHAGVGGVDFSSRKPQVILLQILSRFQEFKVLSDV